jgi:hypothetical protein
VSFDAIQIDEIKGISLRHPSLWHIVYSRKLNTISQLNPYNLEKLYNRFINGCMYDDESFHATTIINHIQRYLNNYENMFIIYLYACSKKIPIDRYLFRKLLEMI